jgi:hypothetical protein
VSAAAVEATSKNGRGKHIRSKGAATLALIFKGIGILIWFASVTAIILSVGSLFNTQLSIGSSDIADALLNNLALKFGVDGLVSGFIVFGIGEVINLLNDIRRNGK